MSASSAVLERAVAEARRKYFSGIRSGDPGGVVLVSSHGRQEAFAAAGTASPQSDEPLTLRIPFDTGSVAKIVTGLAIAILEEEGALSPTARLRDILPEFPAYGDRLRVEHLLHQESGLRNYFGLLYYRAGWHPRLSPSPDEVFQALCRVGSLAFEPGSKYEYCDSNYFLLARIVEHVRGERFGAFARSRILDPLGMKDTYVSDDVVRTRAHAEGYVDYAIDLASPFELRGIGAPRTALQPVRLDYRHVGAEGLYASAHDLALLAKHILFPSLVSPETMRHRILRTPRVRDDGFGYGYGLNVGTYRGRRFIGHDGAIWGYTASLAVFPDEELEIVALTNREDLGAWDLRSAVLDAIGITGEKRTCARPATKSAPSSKKPPEHLVGMYFDPEASRALELAQKDGGLTVSISGSAPIDLDRVGTQTLQGPGGNPTISFPATQRRRPALTVHEGDGETSTFVPFIGRTGRRSFLEYEGPFHCAELATTFDVEAVDTGIRLRNRDPRRPSMDLDYTPTIHDRFWSRDPYPELIEIRFLREADVVCAFVYRGGREDLLFTRLPKA